MRPVYYMHAHSLICRSMWKIIIQISRDDVFIGSWRGKKTRSFAYLWDQLSDWKAIDTCYDKWAESLHMCRINLIKRKLILKCEKFEWVLLFLWRWKRWAMLKNYQVNLEMWNILIVIIDRFEWDENYLYNKHLNKFRKIYRLNESLMIIKNQRGQQWVN